MPTVSASEMQDALELAAPSCAAEDLRDEIVALNIESGVYFSLRGLAVGIWRDLVAGRPVGEVAEAHAAACGGEGAEVRALAAELGEHGLLRPGGSRRLEGQPETAALLAAGTRDIVFEVYTDMQDLILSDPIHNADETEGWPAAARG
jgi:hypothetical protein